VIQTPTGFLQQIESHAALHRGGGVKGARELSARSTNAEERQHDETHQRVAERNQRSGARFPKPPMEDAEHAADDGLCGQRRGVAPRRSAFIVEHQRETVKDLPSTGQHRRAGLRRMRHQEPCERGLLVEELEQHEQPRPHTIQPALLGLEGRARALAG
jgi:hypothetical protein